VVIKVLIPDYPNFNPTKISQRLQGSTYTW